ncbi:MAG: hypothetical protein RQM92_04575 [Candidatus Syntrophopropionicum ammoniitolerans]
MNHLRPVQLEDLLRREPVRVDLQEITSYLHHHTVLVTGAGGSSAPNCAARQQQPNQKN